MTGERLLNGLAGYEIDVLIPLLQERKVLLVESDFLVPYCWDDRSVFFKEWSDQIDSLAALDEIEAPKAPRG